MSRDARMDELQGELVALKGRVRKLEKDKARMEKMFDAALKQLSNLQEKPWEPVDFELTSSREARLKGRREK